MVAADDNSRNRGYLFSGIIPAVQTMLLASHRGASLVQIACAATTPLARKHVSSSYLLVESPKLPVLLRNGHALQVLVVAYGLEVAAYQQEVDGVAVFGLEGLDVSVDGVELAVAAPFNGNLGAVGTENKRVNVFAYLHRVVYPPENDFAGCTALSMVNADTNRRRPARSADQRVLRSG